jgi:hypothetical protein
MTPRHAPQHGVAQGNGSRSPWAGDNLPIANSLNETAIASKWTGKGNDPGSLP